MDDVEVLKLSCRSHMQLQQRSASVAGQPVGQGK